MQVLKKSFVEDRKSEGVHIKHGLVCFRLKKKGKNPPSPKSSGWIPTFLARFAEIKIQRS